MSVWRRLRHGLRGLLRPGAVDRELQDEIAHYLDEAAREQQAGGVGLDAARRAARLELGGEAAVREEVRTARWESVVFDTAADVRYALRLLRKAPAFTLVAVLVIALGTGAVTTIFSGLNALALRPLPGSSDGDRLVQIDRRRPDADDGISASYEYFDYLRRNTRTMEGIAAWSKASFAVAVRGEGIAVFGNLVSGNYFSLLGVHPALGRFFRPEEDSTRLTHPVMVVSHAFWERHLGADSGVVGRTVSVNGNPYTVVGVAEPSFHGVFTPLLVDAWVPLAMQAQLRPGRNLDHALWLWTFGRLGPGVREAAADRELTDLTARYIAARTEPADRSGYRAVRLTALNGLPADAHQMAVGFVALLLGAAVLVLLIASVNVASLLSARAIARRREMAVRAALGAGRIRLIRQILTEILVLFAAGAAGGIWLTLQATAALERLSVPVDVPMVLEVSPDGRVFAFAVLLSLATGLVAGLAPALRAVRHDVSARLRDGSAGAGTGRRLVSNGLIVGQLALSLVLLVTAGLFLRALDRGLKTDPGFEAAGVATAAFNTESWGYGAERGQAFYDELRRRLEAIPGVTAVSFTTNLPLAFATMNGRVRLPGEEPTDGERAAGRPIQMSLVDRDYFRSLRLPILAGRSFDRTDDARAPRVAVVNETLARRFWPDGSALGRTFYDGDDAVTIVGVARDAKYGSLSETMPAFAYFPLAQRWQAGQDLLVRATASVTGLPAAVQEAVLAFDPILPRPAVTTLSEAQGIVLLPQRVAALVTGALGGAGLLLATVGLYGVIAYGVNRRTREIGLRVALGADRRDVLRLIVGEGLRLAAIGVAAGLAIAALATRLLASLLFTVSPLDPLTFGLMSLLFVLVAWLASYLPARRAAAADPMAALRVD